MLFDSRTIYYQTTSEIMSLFKKYSFKSILTLVSGNVGAQVITFLAALILARLYSPEDFGILGVFLAISNILTPISCLGYEAAIIIAKDLREALSVCILCLLISACFSTVLFIPIILCKQYIIHFFNTPELYPYIYIIPISVFLGGLYNILNYYNTKLKCYKNIAVSNIIKSSYCALVQILGSFFRNGAGMLIIGQATMNLFGNLKLIKNVRYGDFDINIQSLLRTYKRFIKFPKFYFWGVLSNNISINATNILIKKLFSASDVGFYSYAYKYIGFPLSLIATSTGQVYFQELSDAKLNGDNIIKVFKDTLAKLLIMGIPIFTSIFFIIKPAFVFLFGIEWETAGEIGQMLTPLFFSRFIISPLSMTFLAFEKQNYLLFWQVLIMVCTLTPYIVIKHMSGTIYNYIYIVVGLLSLCYVMYLTAIYIIIRKYR